MQRLRKITSSRAARFETFEPRQMMSANALTDMALDETQSIYHQSGEPELTALNYAFTGVTNVRNNYGLTGVGQTVVIIDSGIAYNHLALGGGFGAGYRVVGGWDFAENDANPFDDAPGGSHGTHVAGILAAADGTNPGIATGVDLIALRVFNDSGAGTFTWLEQALQWVHLNRNAFRNPITTINLSVGASWNASTPPNWAMLEDEFLALKNDGIFISVAAGNSFASYGTPGTSYPAASSYVVPVASVGANGNLSGFSQRDSRVIAAPGENLRSTVPDYAGNNNGVGDDWANMSGTSMAAPYVAGASMLIREALQLAGYTNINQDLIYAVMRNTADSIFDSATNANYLRLNLERAIDSIIPADDFGNSVGTATGIGAIINNRTITGLIGRTSDVDFFSFTASQSGVVTFTASATGDLAAQWRLAGGGVANGATYTMNVAAGQTYALGIGTTAGIGRFTITASLVGNMTNLGAVDFRSVSNLNLTGPETWYAFTASRTGTVTVEAFFAHAGGNVNIEVYNTNGQLLGSSAGTGNSERIDFNGLVGQTVYLRVIGTNANVDLRLTNLVSREGSLIMIAGTTGNDTFSFTGGSTLLVNVNGVSYQFAAAGVAGVVFSGGAGNDTATLTGTNANDYAILRVQSAYLAGPGYAAYVSGVENMTIDGLGGVDTADLFDSAGDDTLQAGPTQVRLSGNGFDNVARGFEVTAAYASTGYDVATFTDSAGNDTFIGQGGAARMMGTGFNNLEIGFDQANASSSGGGDIAYFYDSAGNDIFYAGPTSARLVAGAYSAEATGFGVTYAYALFGGFDQALFSDSAGDDWFQGCAGSAAAGGVGYKNFAVAFEVVSATATTGNDTAYQCDSAGNDVLSVTPTTSLLYGNGFYNMTRGFGRLFAYSTGGYDLAYLMDSADGDASLVGNRGTALFSGAGYQCQVNGFKNVFAYSSATGDNTASLNATDYLFSLLGNRWRRV